MKTAFGAFLAGQFADRKARTAILVCCAYWFAALLFFEILLHCLAFGRFSASFLLTAGFTAAIALMLSAALSFVPAKAQFPVQLVLVLVITVLYGSQLVYSFVFGTLYSVSLVQQGGAALTAFWKETLLTMWQNAPYLLLLLLPLLGLILLQKLSPGVLVPSNTVCRCLSVLAAVLLHISVVSCLPLGGTGYFTNYSFYYSSDTTTDQAASRFGLLTAFRLDLSVSGESTDDEGYFTAETEPSPVLPNPTVPSGTAAADPTEPTAPVYNVLEIDFDYLDSLTEDKKLLALNDYFRALSGTEQNEYTGMLRDYNLIVLCAESFSTGAIHPELTPTLYRMSTEGIIFNNYYSSYPNNTTDGEYSICMGLYPDGTRDKYAASFYLSQYNYLPFTLGNAFSSQLGVSCWGYHNYNGDFYSRKTTHPNMGYTMKFAGDGMRFTSEWPASDYEMLLQSVDDYISQEQFHAYYMTFSGHYIYDTAGNLMAERNYSQVEDLEGYSYEAKCYLSCNIELEKALAYLMQRLEEAGIADRTAIVLAGDHFPYGLSDAQYSELVGYTVDGFTKYKSSLLFWVGGLEETITVEEYCSNADILPTVLNLWGLEYDSRMLAGTDVFSNGIHVAVLNDHSFFTDKLWFNASTGEIRYPQGTEVSDAYIDAMTKLVKTRFSVSVDILNTNYYEFVFQNDAGTAAP